MARNKARVATRNMAMSRQKKLDKMDVIELAKEKPKPEFHFMDARATGKTVFETKELVIGYDEPLSVPLSFVMERGEKIAVTGANGIGKTTFLKSILGLIPRFPEAPSWAITWKSVILSRKWLRGIPPPASRKSGRNFRPIPSIRFVRLWQNAA